MQVLIELFMTFAKIGAFTFGGGYAMISLIEDICVEKKKWITHEEMMDITVIAESTPGPIAINCATYVGYKRKKLLGAIFATIGMILPSFVIIYIISKYLDGFLEIKWVANAFHGIKIAVGLLIVDAAVKMLSNTKMTVLKMVIISSACIAVLVINIYALHISSLVIMIFAALIGVVSFLIKNKTEGSCAD
ncbi:chromate transporter [Eubacterium uniforme]|uniref:Chromate transporter n=1 Tax=Eubacterium uniforme TaxID=39495 RepID=A0A1T4VH26_9FIRM|nr:chromate transporter [Eubacterium uniforme]SKA64246.1 chromate transporter [Eubacterium uniforme]